MVVAAGGCLAVAACGASAPPRRPAGVVKEWAAAVNGRDWQHACALTVGQRSCERELRRSYGHDRLTFRGAAVNGAGTKPGEAYFSLTTAHGATLFVTAVRSDDGYHVHVDASVLM